MNKNKRRKDKQRHEKRKSKLKINVTKKTKGKTKIKREKKTPKQPVIEYSDRKQQNNKIRELIKMIIIIGNNANNITHNNI